ncbi:MFS transporter OpS2 [Paramyrothecium foliicola]|nr:MFS transporter OpS2 [Paramyrothecium foliicola]
MTQAKDPERAAGHDAEPGSIERPPSLNSDSGETEKSDDHAGAAHPPQNPQGEAHVDSPEGLGEASAAADLASFRPTRSRASSQRSRALTVVPRSKRRGLFGSLAIIPEVERPYDYKNSTKWAITMTVALATAAAPLGSTIFYPALPVLSREFGASETITNLSVALYMLAMSIFPLWWSAFSEEFGRRSIYLISFALFTVFSVLSAVSTNIAMLIVFRICAGGASASVQAVGAGTVADIWESFERGRAMGMFYLGPLLGPVIAPVLGGALTQELGWQATMYCLAIYGLIVLLMLTFLLPETLARRVRDEVATEPLELRRTTTVESAKIRGKKFAASVKRYLIDPLAVIAFLRFPAVLITVLMAAIAFGALFVSNISIQQKFSQSPYNYGQLILGILYVPPGVGYFITSFFGGRWIDHIMIRAAKKANRYDEQGKLILLPEDRMRENIWVAHLVYPLSLLTYGWTLRYGVHVAVPCLASFSFGVASMLVFATATTMLTEFIRKKSSAGVAINNFVRNILSCVGTIVAAPWIHAIDVGWVFTILCIFCMSCGFLGSWLLRKNASKWRQSMEEALKNI